MFGLTKKRRVVQGEPIAEAPLAVLQQPTCADTMPHAALLKRWMSLGEMQQRVIQALAVEIARTSAFVETEADSLSVQFQRLVVTTQQQTARVDSLTEMAMGIHVEGKTVRIEQIAELFGVTLSDVVAKILMLSKDSMAMVYALDTLSASVQNVRQCNTAIDAINSTLNMLALNARIEGERAGRAGAAFRVVANEVYELSKSTKSLAATMKTELKAITDSITTSHDTLKRVATIDLSDNMLVKDQLEILFKALVERNGELGNVVADAVKESETISDDVGGMVVGLQFQDRSKQRLEHVVDTLHVIDQAIEEIRSSTADQAPELMEASAPDTAWVKDLLSRYTMSDMRERFVSQILDGKPVEWPEDTGAVSSSGSAELF